jgi:hypothetical protein
VGRKGLDGRFSGDLVGLVCFFCGLSVCHGGDDFYCKMAKMHEYIDRCLVGSAGAALLGLGRVT